MFSKLFLFILILFISQDHPGVESLSLSMDVLEKLRSITEYLDNLKDVSIFDYIFRINRGVGLNLFQGDIKGYSKRNSQLRTAITNRQQLWNTRVVPYVIDSTFDSASRKDISAAIDEYHQKTCIHWVPRTTEDDYVHFKQISGCFSNVGRTGGEQDISLMGACLKKGTAVHEMMHALGFWHEQSRPDRDSWVHIIMGNIQDGKEYNFEKLDSNEADTLGVQYDYGSVMHYSKYAFSKNGNPTIMPIRPTGSEIGQRDGLSDHDVERIKKLYGCEYPVATTPAPTKKPDTKPPETKPPVTKPATSLRPATIPPLTTKQTVPPATNPPQTNPPVTKPPQTNPPQTNPPHTKPPATNPPQTQPPATKPPPTNPPVTYPPQTKPPATNPPQTNPPVTNPPQTNPPHTRPVQTNPPQTKPQITVVKQTVPAPVYHPGWTLWSAWSPCDLQCKHSRYRFCMNYDRNYCQGVNSEVDDCPNPCKAASTFGCWKQDSKQLTIPSVEGLAPELMDPYKDRKDAIRKCSNYAGLMGYQMYAIFDGGQCLTGPDAPAQFSKSGASSKCNFKSLGSSEAMNVFTFDPDIDGQWSVWTEWGRCTKTCGLGRQYRYRRCDNPPPIGSGAPCQGSDMEVAVCNQGTCIAPIKCGSRYHAGGPGSSGVIWMRDYENFMECEYEIATGDPFSSISIYIHEIDIEYSKGCIYDTLMLYDGYSAHSPLVGAFCGKNSPGTFESSGNEVYLKFTSDETKTGSGFTVFYSINSRTKKACPKPPPTAHSSISMEGNMVGDRAWYSCYSGYKMVGHSPITCIDQPGFALWDDKFPRCVYTRKRSVSDGLGTRCNFQESLCGYMNEIEAEIKWAVKRLSEESGNTSLHGNILHAESTRIHPSDALAQVRTPTYNSVATTYCMTFNYKIDGGDLANFNVYVIESDSDVIPEAVVNTTGASLEEAVSVIMELEGQNENQWRKASLNVKADRSFQIMFEAVLGDEVGSSVSIDDVIINKGYCDPLQDTSVKLIQANLLVRTVPDQNTSKYLP